jgi:hypothetical protein
LLVCTMLDKAHPHHAIPLSSVEDIVHKIIRMLVNKAAKSGLYFLARNPQALVVMLLLKSCSGPPHHVPTHSNATAHNTRTGEHLVSMKALTQFATDVGVLFCTIVLSAV